MPRRNVFAGPYVDRAGHLRRGADWFDNAVRNSASLVVPVWNSRSLVTDGIPRAAFLRLDELPAERRCIDDLVLLGQIGDTPYFACEFEAIDAPPLAQGAHFEDLRLIAAVLPAEQAGLLGYARAMVSWRRRFRFCGTCGSKTLPTRGGHVLVCINPACRHEQFPRLDPAIIVLVEDGERALLGRQASWPIGRYSTIAGFVEPGESLEDAVVREVHEETGVRVGRVEYHSSQPWPFPASLMIGFTARATATEIALLDGELEEARWFTRADIAGSIASGAALLPPPQSISYSLIEDWFDAGAGSGNRLRDLRRAEP